MKDTAQLPNDYWRRRTRWLRLIVRINCSLMPLRCLHRCLRWTWWAECLLRHHLHPFNWPCLRLLRLQRDVPWWWVKGVWLIHRCLLRHLHPAASHLCRLRRRGRLHRLLHPAAWCLSPQDPHRHHRCNTFRGFLKAGIWINKNVVFALFRVLLYYYFIVLCVF